MFNLIPVLPLDGGRIARAFLSNTFGFVKVSKVLAHMGRILGGTMIIIGFYLQAQFFYRINPFTIIILGFFFWLGSSKELTNARIVFLKNLCRKKEQLLSKGLMRSRCITVKKSTPLEAIIDELNMDSYSLISVSGSNDKIEKTLSETQIVQGMLEKGWKCAVGEL
jgi:stage IV sporulation protein FB